MVFLVVAGAVVLCNPWLTRYVESDRFRGKIENETAKGLHFPSGHYAPIRRTGFAADLALHGVRWKARASNPAMERKRSRQ